MRNFVFLLIVLSVCVLATGIGYMQKSVEIENKEEESTATINNIPHIGRVEVLNGCGISGAAGVLAGYLRDKSFDVKNTDNADSWNYTETIVISRTGEMEVAKKVADALGIKDVVLLKNGQDLYNVTVIAGSDFSTLITQEEN